MDTDDLRIYASAMKLGDEVWKIVLTWKYFDKDTIGKQWVRAVDSIAANISEGDGRFHFKERKNFCYYARGSLFETKTWLTKAYQRSLVTEAHFNELSAHITMLARMLNKYISRLGGSGSH